MEDNLKILLKLRKAFSLTNLFIGTIIACPISFLADVLGNFYSFPFTISLLGILTALIAFKIALNEVTNPRN
jgi:Na+/citrate or Na+/malate symporter